MSKPWRKKSKRVDVEREKVERALKFIEDKHGDPLTCFFPRCGKPAIGMDECITCEGFSAEEGGPKKTRILSCGKHRTAGLSALKKHILSKHHDVVRDV